MSRDQPNGRVNSMYLRQSERQVTTVAQRLEHGPADTGTSDEVYSECDHAMIDCALRWVNYGGGPVDDIGTRFEMPAREFYRAVV